MKLLLWIVSALFAGLSAGAAILQMKSAKKALPSALAMAAGSLLLLAAVACGIAKLSTDGVLSLLGCAAICGAALVNGIKSGNLHIQHHIIRFALSAALVTGFFLL